jgi:integrase
LIAAGLLDEYHLHSLRYTFVSWALNRGENIWKIKEWLGHSTLMVTEVYAHNKPEGEINLDLGKKAS